MTLRVTPEEVRSKANEIQTQKSQMDDLMNQMNQAIMQLSSEAWVSNSGTNFAERYQHVQGQCQNSLNTLMTHIDNLRKAAQIYDTTEQAQIQKTNNLGTENIFTT